MLKKYKKIDARYIKRGRIELYAQNMTLSASMHYRDPSHRAKIIADWYKQYKLEGKTFYLHHIPEDTHKLYDDEINSTT